MYDQTPQRKPSVCRWEQNEEVWWNADFWRRRWKKCKKTALKMWFVMKSTPGCVFWIFSLHQSERISKPILPVVSLSFFLINKCDMDFGSVFGSLTTVMGHDTPQCDRILCPLACREALSYEAAAQWPQAELMCFNAATSEAFKTI